MRAHGGFRNVHSEKRRKKASRKFTFEIECSLESKTYHYTLVIHNLDDAPQIEEVLSIDGQLLFTRKKGEKPVIEDDNSIIEHFPETYSALLCFLGMPLVDLLRNISLYRIDPIGAKEPDQSDSDPSSLDKRGHNLASVLNRIASNGGTQNTIMEWMEMIVPGLEKIQTEQQQLESKTAILFKERGTRRRFPANLVSDGTVYALSLLVAVLDKSNSDYGITAIEEPERGLHPYAIRELINLVREQAAVAQPIWMTTHSESVVRQLNLNELVLVNKNDGRTHMKIASSGNLSNADIAPLGMDEAWLSNLLDGGTP